MEPATKRNRLSRFINRKIYRDLWRFTDLWRFIDLCKLVKISTDF